MAKSKKKAVKVSAVFATPEMPMGLSKENEKHLREGYRQVKNAYTFLTARNTQYAQEQLRAGLSKLDLALAPWV